MTDIRYIHEYELHECQELAGAFQCLSTTLSIVPALFIHVSISYSPFSFFPKMSQLSILFTGLSSSPAELSSPLEMIFHIVFVACLTARDVFFAALETTGCSEMIGRLALS